MDCNREEALRAKELAEKKFALQDFAGAKRILAKAEQLYPKLDGLQQLLAVINVHSTSQAKFADELDWYGILEAEVTADDATIRKQYRKLALILHPDKNKCAGAEAAFKLVAEAFAVLSDKTKRLAHDRKRIMTTSGILNAYYGSAPRPAARAAQPSPAYQSAFWTACPHCRMQYQYPKIYENCRLSCGKCKKDFEAKDVHAGLNGYSSPDFVNGRPVNGMGGAGPFFPVFHHANPAANMQAGTAAASASASASAAASQSAAADYVQQMYRKAKEEREETKRKQKANEKEQKKREREEFKKLKELEKGRKEAMKNLKDDLCKSKPEMENLKKDVLERESSKEPEIQNLREDVLEKDFSKSKPQKSRKRPRSADGDDDEEEVATEVLHGLRTGPPVQPRRSSRLRRNIIYNFDEDDDVAEFPSRKKSKDEPVEQGNHENGDSVSSGSGVPTESGLPNDNAATNINGMANQSDKLNANPPVEPARPPQTPAEAAQVVPDSSGDSPGTADQEKTIIQVPDTDFHDFDEERDLHNVGEGQLWAVYDDFNAMPRFYCRVEKVKSAEKIGAKWLRGVETSEDTRLWLQAGFHLACGELRLMRKGNTELSPDMLSHQVRIDPQKGVWKIYPRGGEVWCMYQNWHRDWLTSSENEKRDISYVMVEVVNDFSEEKGVNVAPLLKVQGFSTVFAREVPGSWKHVAAEEILKFSHRVPAFHLTGHERPGVPQGSWELDPAAVPPELLDLKKKL